MARRLFPILLLLSAGCAGGDLMRGEPYGALGLSDEGSTGAHDPLTTGLTGVDDDGGAQGSSGADPTTTGNQPGPSTASGEDGAGDEPPATSSSTGGESGDESTDAGGESTGSTMLPGDAVDLSGWTLQQTNSARSFVLPPDTFVPTGAVVVIGRNASRADFEAYWGALPEEAMYFDAEDQFPAINGDESYTLLDAADAVVDGPTPTLQDGEALRRDDLSTSGSWTVATELDADPGTGHDDPGASGVFLTEVSDATGAGNYVFEYVELQAWQ